METKKVNVKVVEVPIDKIVRPKGSRETRKQQVDAHAAMIEAKQEGKPFKSPGEYLGDFEVTDALFNCLRNVNPNVNSIGEIPRGTYLLIADFDYEGDGHFMGLRLERRTE